MIALIDYGSGNLRSAEKALARVGADVRIVNRPADVREAAAVVLPGVGAFGDCVKNLTRLGLDVAIREFIATGKPFLGICVGLQMLFESGAESPGVAGLGVLPGTVPRLATNGLKVPHMGWNRLRVRQAKCPLFAGLEDVGRVTPRGAASGGAANNGPWVYFVHSYYGAPRQDSIVAATTEYGIEFASVICSGNIYATQFHPEKSQAVGLQMLENFVRLA
jgi:imidazole glycerol-phosphate synthase subunit HisH